MNSTMDNTIPVLGGRGAARSSYVTLACGKVLGDPVIGDIAAARGATPAQVVLAWAMQAGYAVIPSSTKRVNLESSLKAAALVLTAAR